MNNLTRTVHAALETNINNYAWDLDQGKGKRAFQFIKWATGKNQSYPADYSCEALGPWYGYDVIAITGKRGFIKLALTPLFQVID